MLTYTAGQGRRPSLTLANLAAIGLIPRGRTWVILGLRCLKTLWIYSPLLGVQNILACCVYVCVCVCVDVKRVNQSCKPWLVIGRGGGVSRYGRADVLGMVTNRRR